MAYAQPSDVRARWIAPQSVGQWSDETMTRLIAEAEDTVDSRFPELREKLANGEIPEIRVNKVVVRMVIRALRNPSGMRTIQESAGPFSGSATFGGDEPGELYLSAQDIEELAGRPTVARVSSIRVLPVRPWSV